MPGKALWSLLCFLISQGFLRPNGPTETSPSLCIPATTYCQARLTRPLVCPSQVWSTLKAQGGIGWSPHHSLLLSDAAEPHSGSAVGRACCQVTFEPQTGAAGWGAPASTAWQPDIPAGALGSNTNATGGLGTLRLCQAPPQLSIPRPGGLGPSHALQQPYTHASDSDPEPAVKPHTTPPGASPRQGQDVWPHLPCWQDHGEGHNLKDTVPPEWAHPYSSQIPL